jgi:two-component system, NarL family, response regulator LiaR
LRLLCVLGGFAVNLMKKLVLYGLILAALIFLLKIIEYKFLISSLSVEFYIAIIAVMFTVVGVWGGLKLTATKKVIIEVPVSQFTLNEENLRRLEISKREYEVLELMSTGLTNQDIADRLSVSLNTVKTHTSSLFLKMDVKRRTQAIQKAKDLSLIP